MSGCKTAGKASRKRAFLPQTRTSGPRRPPWQKSNPDLSSLFFLLGTQKGWKITAYPLIHKSLWRPLASHRGRLYTKASQESPFRSFTESPEDHRETTQPPCLSSAGSGPFDCSMILWFQLLLQDLPKCIDPLPTLGKQ